MNYEPRRHSPYAWMRDFNFFIIFQGRLNELLCAVRLQRSASAGASHERYQLDPGDYLYYIAGQILETTGTYWLFFQIHFKNLSCIVFLSKL